SPGSLESGRSSRQGCACDRPGPPAARQHSPAREALAIWQPSRPAAGPAWNQCPAAAITEESCFAASAAVIDGLLQYFPSRSSICPWVSGLNASAKFGSWFAAPPAITFLPSCPQASTSATLASSRDGIEPLNLLNSVCTAGSIISVASLSCAAF